MSQRLHRTTKFALAVIVMMLTISPAYAHCDAEDGPVIKDARVALEKGDVSPVLKWIGPDDEAEIRTLFGQVMEARATGETARAIADRLFFETLVRVHRAGEGAPFDGVKPAGHLEPYVAKIDAALASGEGSAVADAIAEHVRHEVETRFAATDRAAETKDASAEAGREYVAAYVELVHFIKGIHEAVVAGGTHSHAAATEHAHGGAK